MAKKLKTGKSVGQKAGVVLAERAMQQNVQGQFDLVNAGLSGPVKKKYNPEPEIAAMVGMVDTVPAVAKYVFKQAQPLLESNNVKSSKVGVKIVVEVVRAQPEGADDALRMMKSLLNSKNSSAMTKEAAERAMVAVVKVVPQLAKNAFGQMQPLLQSRDADVVKMATKIIIKMVKTAPQVEVAQEALAIVQGLLGDRNVNSFNKAMKIMAEVVKIAPAVPQIEGGILKTLVTIIRNTPEVEVAKEVLELANSLIASGDANLIQTAARVITNVVKIVPGAVIKKEALKIMQPLLQGESADSMKVALDTITSIVQLAPTVALAKHVFKLTQPLLESDNADFAQMAAKTVTNVVRTLSQVEIAQVEIAQEALSLVGILIANKNVEAAGMALEGIVQAVPRVEVAKIVLGMMPSLLESGNPAFVKMAAKTVTDVVRTLSQVEIAQVEIAQVEIAQEALGLVGILIENRNIDDAKMAFEGILKAVPRVEVAHRILGMMPPLLESGNSAFIQAGVKMMVVLVEAMPKVELAIGVVLNGLGLLKPLLESDNTHFVKMAVGALKEVVQIVRQTEVAHASLTLVQTMIANRNHDAAQEAIEVIVKAVSEAKIAQMALGLVQPLLESNNSVFIQAGVKMMVGVVKAMPPQVEIAQDVLGRLKPLLESNNASLVQVASKAMQDIALIVPQVKNNVLEVMSELFKVSPQREVVQEILKHAVSSLSSKDAFSVKVAVKTITEAVTVFPTLVDEAFTMLKPLLLDNHAKASANEAIVGIVQALPKPMVAYSAFEVVRYGQEDYFGNIRAERSTAKTVVEIVRSVPEVAVRALDIPNRWLDIMASDAGKAALAYIMSGVVGIVPEARVAELALDKLCSLFRVQSLEAIEASKAMAAIVKAVPEVAPRALSITHTYIRDTDLAPYALSGIVQYAPQVVDQAFGIIQSWLSDRWCSSYTELRAAKALAGIAQAVPDLEVVKKVLKLFKPLIGSKYSGFSNADLPYQLVKIVKAQPHPEVVKGALELAQLAYNSTFQSGLVPSVIREIMEIAPTASTATELRKVIYHLNQERGCDYDSFKLSVSLANNMTQKLLRSGVSGEEVLEQVNSLVGGMFSAPEAAALVVQVVHKNPTLKVAEKALAKIEWILMVIFNPKQIDGLSKEGYAPQISKSLIEILQAVPEGALARKALGLVKPLYKKYAPEATKIVIEIVKIDPKLVKDVLHVLMVDGATDCAVNLFKAMPWLASEVLERGYDAAAKRDIAAKVKVQREYGQYVKGVNAQVQEHLALGYLGVDKEPHITKALGVVDEYVTLGDD